MSSQYNLTSNEKNVLIALENLKDASPDELAEKSKMKMETSMQAAFLLEEKGLTKVEETITEILSLQMKEKSMLRKDCLKDR